MLRMETAGHAGFRSIHVGNVQQFAIHTIGGVVTPAQPLLVIVPEEDRLEVEAWVENKDIGSSTPGRRRRSRWMPFRSPATASSTGRS